MPAFSVETDYNSPDAAAGLFGPAPDGLSA